MIKQLVLNSYLDLLLKDLERYYRSDASLEEDSIRIRMKTLKLACEIAFAPANYNLLCQNCNHAWGAIFPHGLSSPNVECPKCHKMSLFKESSEEI